MDREEIRRGSSGNGPRGAELVKYYSSETTEFRRTYQSSDTSPEINRKTEFGRLLKYLKMK